jgi:3-hydroxybutyryl-CoA dehydrogenase
MDTPMKQLINESVLVIGAGIMGAGITQVAAQSGHLVYLFDQKEGAAEKALESIKKTFTTLVSKAKVTEQQALDTLSRIHIITSLEQASQVNLVVEAILEKLDIKRQLFSTLEKIVSSSCVLATNTSSISVTAIANGLNHPERLVGMHFFNPVPLMKLVEVVSGLQTSPDVAQAIFNLSLHWGKTPVHAKSTPGFIVNRIARPFYAEALAMFQEQMADIVVIDACIKSAGFKMGSFELMDLIGNDTNFAVTSSVYEAFFFDSRFRPSIVQKEYVDGGLFGRKSGRGFYDYSAGAINPSLPAFDASQLNLQDPIVLHGQGSIISLWSEKLVQLNIPFTQNTQSDWIGLEVGKNQLRQTQGNTASSYGSHVALFDQILSTPSEHYLAWSISQHASTTWQTQAPSWLAHLSYHPLRVKDMPGLIVARTIAMLINEAADTVNQGVCSRDASNQAMRLGVNYPAGPFEWLDAWTSTGVLKILDGLDHHYKGERYRASPLLRQLNY